MKRCISILLSILLTVLLCVSALADTYDQAEV